MILSALCGSVIAFLCLRRLTNRRHVSPVMYTSQETINGFYTREMYGEGWRPFPPSPWRGNPVSLDAYLNAPRLRLVPKS